MDKFDERINDDEVANAEVESKVGSLKSNGNGGETRQIKLINHKSITPPLFSGNRNKYMSWARSMKVYLDSQYSGFRKRLDPAEHEESKITMGMVDRTHWRYTREFNTQLLNLMTTYIDLEPQVMINVDPTDGCKRSRNIAQHYDSTAARASLA